MIENALQELNEKAGSTKKSISQYLEKKYDNLPWAHSVLLKHHLEKACEKGEVIVTRSKKYRLAGSLNSSPKVEKPQQRKCMWECESQKHVRLIKKINNQRVEKVEAAENRHECDEKEQPSTENKVHGRYQSKSLLSCVDGERCFHSNPTILDNEPPGMIAAADEKKCTEEVRSQQENGPSAIAKADISAAHTPEHQEREQSEHEQPGLSTPERPPGFESVIVENLHQLGLTEPEPEPDVVEVMNSKEKSKLPAVLQNEHAFEPYIVIDSSNLSFNSNEPEFALSTEQEPKELLQQTPSEKEEVFQGKQLRRSLRTRSAKPQLSQDANVIVALPVTVCRNQGLLLKQRPRSWPPPKPMKATSMDELQDSPKSQKQRKLLKQIPVKNLKVVDDCGEQEIKQLEKVAECASMHEKMEVFPPDDSKPHLQKAVLKEQQLGRPPKRCSARLLKQR